MSSGQGDGRGRRPAGEAGHPPAPRRMPPPESTGAEAEYLARHREERTPMVVQMVDGEVFRGWIEYYDRDMVKINRHQGPNVFIRKHHIRYMYEDQEQG
jgi:host factor-I protein